MQNFPCGIQQVPLCIATWDVMVDWAVELKHEIAVHGQLFPRPLFPWKFYGLPVPGSCQWQWSVGGGVTEQFGEGSRGHVGRENGLQILSLYPHSGIP